MRIRGATNSKSSSKIRGIKNSNNERLSLVIVKHLNDEISLLSEANQLRRVSSSLETILETPNPVLVDKEGTTTRVKNVSLESKTNQMTLESKPNQMRRGSILLSSTTKMTRGSVSLESSTKMTRGSVSLESSTKMTRGSVSLESNTNQMKRNYVSLESKTNQMTYLSMLLKINPVPTSGLTRPIFVPNAHTDPALVKRMITPKDYSKVFPKVKTEKD